MQARSRSFLVILLLVGVLIGIAVAPASRHEVAAAEPTRLGVVWTSADPDVAIRMVFMYTLAAKRSGWFDEVRLVVWGPSSKLLSENSAIQEEMALMQAAGVETVACKACADSYGVSDELTALGLEVKYMGKPLSDMLLGDWKVITF